MDNTMIPLLYLMATICLQVNGYFHEPSVRLLSPPKTRPLRDKSLFGYSLAYQRDSKQLIISAPRADNVGKIFSTNFDTGDVTLIPLNITRDNRNQDDFWLGATVKANSTSFITCAPRSTNYKHQFYAHCFYGTSPERIYSLPTKSWIQLNAGLNSYGWSVNMDTDIYVGSPILTGSVRVLATDAKVQSENDIIEKFLLYHGSIENYNFGYSMVSGKFFSDDFLSLAVSSTYGEDGQGKIFFYEDRYEVWSITDDKVGSMYGAVLAVANLDGSRSSLLVGAPTYNNKAHGYDGGAVYLYIPDYHSNTLTLKRVVSGVSDGGYFGAAIVSVGDMDGDGLDEVAIGAPFDDDGKGAVYIYTGAGLLEDHAWAQKIHAPEGLLTFGMSLTALDEFTNNGCNGLAISAPDSNIVAVYKGIPLITVVLSTNYSSLQGRKNPDFFEIEPRIKVEYTLGLGKVEAEISVKIEIMHPNAKLAGAGEDGTLTYNVPLASKPAEVSRTIKVLTPTDGDYEQVITYKVSAELINSPVLDRDFRSSQVAVSDRSVLLSLGSIWAADCGSIECNPILTATLTSSIPDIYAPGSTDNETISISLRNDGETAYSPCIRVRVSTARILQPSSSCVRTDEGLFTCKPKRLLHTGGDVWNTGNIYLETSDLTSADKSIRVQYDVYNHCNKEEKTHYEKIFPLQSASNGIIIQGISNTEETVNITSLDIEVGKRLQHIYTISNLGTTNWASVQCEVVLPRRKYLDTVENPIKINTELSVINCHVNAKNDTDDDIKALCNIGDLRRNKVTKIFISMFVVPKGLEHVIEKEDVKLMTKISLLLDEPKSYSITNTLRYNYESVSSWIIVLAILFALLVIIIIGFVLYKRGFLQRKKKQRLENLRKSNKSLNSQSQKASATQNEQEDEDCVVSDDQQPKKNRN